MSAATIDAEGLVMGFTFDYVGRNLSAAATRINAVETLAVAKVSRSSTLTCLCSPPELIATVFCSPGNALGYNSMLNADLIKPL